VVKFFILAPVFIDYNGDLIEENLAVFSSGNKKTVETIMTEAGLKKFSSEVFHYHANQQEVLNIANALAQERNLYPYYLEISHNTIGEISTVASLIVDDNLKFLVAFEIECTGYTDAGNFIYESLKNRSPIENLGLSGWSDEVLAKAKTVVLDIMGQCAKSVGVSAPVGASFVLDSFYPLAVSDEAVQMDMTELFSNEESGAEQSHSSLGSDNKDAFVRIGWNYALSLGLNDATANLKIISFLLFLQSYYYQMRFFKLYFLNKLEDLIVQKEISKTESETFARLKISYHKFTLHFMNYKTGLNPKYYSEFEKVELLWHLKDDMEIIDRAFEIQNDRADKLYQATVEKDNDTQNLALKLITVLQIFGIYSIYYDGLQLSKEPISYFKGATLLAVILSVVIVALLWKNGFKAMFTNKKRD
jgi:hypothetical protein